MFPVSRWGFAEWLDMSLTSFASFPGTRAWNGVLGTLFLASICFSSPEAWAENISDPLDALAAQIKGLHVISVETDSPDRGLSLEVVLASQSRFDLNLFNSEESLDEEVAVQILAVCERLLAPMVDKMNSIEGFPPVDYARVKILEDPLAALGPAKAGRYFTVGFKIENGCQPKS